VKDNTSTAAGYHLANGDASVGIVDIGETLVNEDHLRGAWAGYLGVESGVFCPSVRRFLR